MSASEHVHFIGIGGYGMSAIARVMLDMGYVISGSDVAKKELTDKLQDKGAKVYIGHEEKNVDGADIVVYSTDIPKDNVEMKAAQKCRIPLIHRSEMLAKLMNMKSGIAVSGAHGKTTTSSMISLVMEKCHLDPTYIIGGEILDVGSNAKAGKGEYVVAEADESDGSFLHYHPKLAVITNIEPDHLENYEGDFENLKKAYRQFLSNIQPDGTAVLCADDAYLREIKEEIDVPVITYGIDHDADYQAKEITLGDRTASFVVEHHGRVLGTIKLSLPGKHNVYNALATIIICLQVGIPFQDIAKTITSFQGAKRRFQVMSEANDILVVDDYAHHPTEIQATIAAAKSTERRIIAVFQPQRYTRTYFLLEAFSRAFGEADHVVIADIYSPAGEKRIEGVTAEKLVELIKVNSNPNTVFIPTKEDIQEYLLKTIKPNDLVITMGAGDIWKVAAWLVSKMKAGTWSAGGMKEELNER